MRGDAKVRFCEECQLHVHNLSTMSREERDQFVAKTTSHTCIAYELRRDGTLVTPSFWSDLLKPFSRIRFASVALLAALLPFFPACTSRRVVPGGITPPDSAAAHGSNANKTDTVTMLGVPCPVDSTQAKSSQETAPVLNPSATRSH